MIQFVGWVLILGPIIGTMIVLAQNVPFQPSDRAELDVWDAVDAIGLSEARKGKR